MHFIRTNKFNFRGRGAPSIFLRQELKLNVFIKRDFYIDKIINFFGEERANAPIGGAIIKTFFTFTRGSMKNKKGNSLKKNSNVYLKF